MIFYCRSCCLGTDFVNGLLGEGVGGKLAIAETPPGQHKGYTRSMHRLGERADSECL